VSVVVSLIRAALRPSGVIQAATLADGERRVDGRVAMREGQSHAITSIERAAAAFPRG
jgi:hypothetical protein